MGLDMRFYKLPKGTTICSHEDLYKYEPFKYFGKKYCAIHEIMYQSAFLEEEEVEEITDNDILFLSPVTSCFCGFGEYKITKRQYKLIIQILKSKDLNKYIGDYDENYSPKQLLEILKDFDKYDFWYTWCD